jgi:hypothetical protein
MADTATLASQGVTLDHDHVWHRRETGLLAGVANYWCSLCSTTWSGLMAPILDHGRPGLRRG